MMITLHLVDGRKITKDKDKLLFFSMQCGYAMDSNGGVRRYRLIDGILPGISDGYITVNLDHVVDMRPAEEDEIQHAQIHGW